MLNITTGARFTTYAIDAVRGSRVIEVNGAATRLVQRGDKVIVVTYPCRPEGIWSAQPHLASTYLKSNA